MLIVALDMSRLIGGEPEKGCAHVVLNSAVSTRRRACKSSGTVMLLVCVVTLL